MAVTTCKVCGNGMSATVTDCQCVKHNPPAFVKYELAILALFFIVVMVAVKDKPRILTATKDSAVLLDIRKIAGKTQAEVEKRLGEPVLCSQAESALNCSYKDNEIDIVFIGGKADWITVNGTFRSPSYSQELEGKSKVEILKQLGDPVFCVRAKSKSALNCSFKDGDVSVEFIDGKVVESSVRGRLGKVPSGKDALAVLGLPVKDASFSNEHVMRWDNIPGLLNVTLHLEGGVVSVATVKVKTQ